MRVEATAGRVPGAPSLDEACYRRRARARSARHPPRQSPPLAFPNSLRDVTAMSARSGATRSRLVTRSLGGRTDGFTAACASSGRGGAYGTRANALRIAGPSGMRVEATAVVGGAPSEPEPVLGRRPGRAMARRVPTRQAIADSEHSGRAREPRCGRAQGREPRRGRARAVRAAMRTSARCRAPMLRCSRIMPGHPERGRRRRWPVSAKW